jgi:uncharacterized protein YecT (DUF1311 family)
MSDSFKGLVVGLVAAVLAVPVLAQTQLEITTTAARDFAEADGRLNKAYRALVAKLPSEQVAKLREAQQTWLRFREQECAFETMRTVGESAHRLAETYCRTRFTEERINHLEADLKCRDANHSCVY